MCKDHYQSEPNGTACHFQNEDYRKEMECPLLGLFEVVDANAAKTIVYYGMDEVIPGFRAFVMDYLNAESNSGHKNEWQKKNEIYVLVNWKTKETLAIRTFGVHHIDEERFLFQTDYLPVHGFVEDSEEVLKNRIIETAELFAEEIHRMTEAYNKPLFLIREMDRNNYKAWSLSEHKYVYVYEYKAYRKNFRISDTYTTSLDDTKENTEYGIIPPSDELIYVLGPLHLFSNRWCRKLRGDKWDPLPEKVPEKLPDNPYTELYNEAVHFINLGRVNYLGNEFLFDELEEKTKSLEFQIEYNARHNDDEGYDNSIVIFVNSNERNTKKTENLVNEIKMIIAALKYNLFCQKNCILISEQFDKEIDYPCQTHLAGSGVPNPSKIANVWENRHERQHLTPDTL